MRPQPGCDKISGFVSDAKVRRHHSDNGGVLPFTSTFRLTISVAPPVESQPFEKTPSPCFFISLRFTLTLKPAVPLPPTS